MNTMQEHRRSRLEKLLDTLDFSDANKAMALEYLTAQTADDRLLQKAEKQDFRALNSRKRSDAVDRLTALRHSQDTDLLCRCIRLFWAIGQSTATVLLESEYDFKTRCAERDLRIRLLGKPAVAALEADNCAWKSLYNYDQLEWLHTLASTEPQTLETAQTMIGGKWDNPRVLLAGILLCHTPVPGLLKKLAGNSAIARQTECIFRNNIDSLNAAAPALPQTARDALADYIRRGDLGQPLAKPVGGAQNLPSRVLGDHYLTGLLGTASFLAQRHDPRARCAVRVYMALNSSSILRSVLSLAPKEYLLEQLDTLAEDLPGGKPMLLLELTDCSHWMRQDVRDAVLRRYADVASQALQQADANQYAQLCSLLHLAVPGFRSNAQERIIDMMEKDVLFGKSDLRAYLTGTGSLRDSAAQLSALKPGTQTLYQTVQVVRSHWEEVGWDDFTCRCVVVLALVFQTYNLDQIERDEKDVATLAEALTKKELPFTMVLDVMGNLYDRCWNENRKVYIRNAAYAAASGADFTALCTAAETGTVFARYVALSALSNLAVLPDDRGARAKSQLLACAGDSSKQIQELLLAIFTEHPQWSDGYTALLSSKKAPQRLMAARVAAQMTDTMRPALEKALQTEKSAKVADVIRAALGKEEQAGEAAAPDSPDAVAEKVLKGGKKRRVQWLLDLPLPELHFHDDAHTPVSEERRAALLVAFCEQEKIGRSATAALLAQGIDEAELSAFACEVYEAWMAAGAPSKTKWVLAFAAVFGGAAMTPRLQHVINEWPQHSRGAMACVAVEALSLSTDPAALLIVDSISRKFKFRQVKTAAAAAMKTAAEELGITAEELADRIVPDLGFAADGRRVFDYGPRRFTVRLTPAMELEITNDAGKTIKNLPSPGKTDDEAKAGAAYAEFKALKKQMRTVIDTQKKRLEAALSSQRCWNSDAWQTLFVRNPIMHQFAISLIWGVYEEGRLLSTFRYMEDGSFNTVDEEEYTLPDGAQIGLVHPVELDASLLADWKQQLEDYEIIQSIPQLDRLVYTLAPGEEKNRSLETFGGKMLNGLSLSGKLQGMGWYRGSVQDGGGYYTFYREDPSLGFGVELRFSGCFVGDENETVTVFDAVFYKAGTVQRGSYCYDEPNEDAIFALGSIPARYYSEIVYQLTRATASSTETDPDWKHKRH